MPTTSPSATFASENNSVLDEAAARAVAERFVAEKYAASEHDLIVMDENTRAFAFGWSFVFQTRAYVETRDRNKMVTGNGPLVVDARNGAIYALGSHPRFQAFVADYEQSWASAPPPQGLDIVREFFNRKK
jgi:Immunity protein 35